ncbi:MAG: alpha-galactosidase [Clostridiales bacterium]|nr:alpha-galactosidase [Clostridiales bacterium]
MPELHGKLCYNGQNVFLSPGKTTLDGTLEAELEYRPISDLADYLLLRLRNPGSADSKRVTGAKTLSLSVETDAVPCYHSLWGDDCGAASFMPRDFDLTSDFHEEPTGGRSSNTTGFPFFDIQYGGSAMLAAIGWTGQWSKDVTLFSGGFTVEIGLCDCDFYLKPGESVRLPSLLLLRGSDAAELRREFRRTLRDKFSPRALLGDGFRVPIAIQCFDRYFQALSNSKKDESWASESGQIRTVDEALKARHFDTLWLDAAWFEKGFPHGVGNYRFSEGFPRGLKPVSDYAHKNGMQFVLWFEPERIFRGSDLFGREEFLLMTDPGSDTRLFNLADGEARRWLTETLVAMIRGNGIDVYRQDFNMDPLPYWRANDEPGRRGITEMKYVEGLYRLWDDLLSACPGLWIDNCSSGGRRLDFETASRSITLWRSDTGCFAEDEERRVTVWNNNQILGLSEYLPFHACAVWDSDAYTVRSSATHGLACNFDIFNPAFDFDKAEKALREVCELKSCWDGDFYPLTQATLDESVWSAYQLAFADSGAVYAFRREKSEAPCQTFSLAAVDPDGTYELVFIDERFERTRRTVPGREMAQGLALCIPSPRESLIVRYRKL